MMDRRLKERLVGATILVALIVAIVPELLSGPKPAAPSAAAPLNLPAAPPAATHTVKVDLSTRKATDMGPPPNPEPAAPAQVPPPSEATATPAAPEAGAALNAAAAPPTRAPPLETAPSPPKSVPGTHSVWAVQLGSFVSKANADKLAQQLKAQGTSVYVISTGSGPSLRYRVRMGPMADRAAALRALEKLKAAGHPATLVTPSS